MLLVHTFLGTAVSVRKPAAAGLLLWARRAEDIDRLSHASAQRLRRANAGSATLSAYVKVRNGLLSSLRKHPFKRLLERLFWGVI